MSQLPPIFISHVETDTEHAEWLHHALRAAGLSPWCASIDIHPGDQWDRAIVHALGRARVVVVLVSSGWPAGGGSGGEFYAPEVVARAIDHARRRDLTVIPVRIDGVDDARMPFGLFRVKPVDVRGRDFEPAVEVLRRIVERVAGATEPRLPPTEPLAAAIQLRQTRAAGGASRAVLDAIDARILSLKQRRVYRPQRRPARGLALDRWLLVERLGRGGFAEVWSAEDMSNGESVALKILHAQFDDHPQRRARFFRGARRMAALRHRSIVRVHEPEVFAEGRHFFVMERLAGGDLEAAVLAGRLKRPYGLKAVAAIAYALDAAHRHDVIHRDVKPSNILLDGRGRPKLTDFDLVRAGDTTGGTRTGGLGTFIYAAPEALEDAARVDVRCDVYGLGMTAAFVLLGERLPQRMLKNPAAVLERLPGFAAVKHEVLRAIEWEPAARHQSAAAFAYQLRRAIKADVNHGAQGPTRERISPGARRMRVDELRSNPRPPVAPAPTEERNLGQARHAADRARDRLPSASAAALVICDRAAVDGEASDGSTDRVVTLRHTVTIGRAANQSVSLEDPAVSQTHAVIHFARGAHWLTDVGSTNGTLLDGERVQRTARLVDGQTICLGDTMLRYVVRETPGSIQPTLDGKGPRSLQTQDPTAHGWTFGDGE